MLKIDLSEDFEREMRSWRRQARIGEANQVTSTIPIGEWLGKLLNLSI